MKKFIILVCSFWVTAAAFPQDPVHWTFSTMKNAEGRFEIRLAATVDRPWHTYSQGTPEGGPLPTKIVFSKNPLITLEGKTIEVGELRTTHDETFGVDVKFFTGNVEFVQVMKLKGKAKTKVTGTVEFMACNDRQCLPPKTIPFTIQIP
ncbi:MAG TPA: protein-disulfide reductase DsbD domain-containing protein [Puia sp.]|nr:protein-disulfide reductase DsbD domain-containing protein [Puia sp.]